MNSQISPRTFALIGGLLIVLMLAFAAHAKAAGARDGSPSSSRMKPEEFLSRAKPLLVKEIQRVGFVCDRIDYLGFNDAFPGGVVQFHAMCGLSQYTLVVETKGEHAGRIIVYPGNLQ
jgi:hypothetical protein